MRFPCPPKAIGGGFRSTIRMALVGAGGVSFFSYMSLIDSSYF